MKRSLRFHPRLRADGIARNCLVVSCEESAHGISSISAIRRAHRILTSIPSAREQLSPVDVVSTTTSERGGGAGNWNREKHRGQLSFQPPCCLVLVTVQNEKSVIGGVGGGPRAGGGRFNVAKNRDGLGCMESIRSVGQTAWLKEKLLAPKPLRAPSVHRRGPSWIH